MTTVMMETIMVMTISSPYEEVTMVMTPIQMLVGMHIGTIRFLFQPPI